MKAVKCHAPGGEVMRLRGARHAASTCLGYRCCTSVQILAGIDAMERCASGVEPHRVNINRTVVGHPCHTWGRRPRAAEPPRARRPHQIIFLTHHTPQDCVLDAILALHVRGSTTAAS